MNSWINSGAVSSRGMMPCRASSFNTVSLYLNITQRMNDRVEASPDRRVLKASESILDRHIDLSRVAIPKVPRPQRHRDLSRPFDDRNKQPIARVVVKRTGHHFGIDAFYCCLHSLFHLTNICHLSSSGYRLSPSF